MSTVDLNGAQAVDKSVETVDKLMKFRLLDGWPDVFLLWALQQKKKMMSYRSGRDKALKVLGLLEACYPEADCALQHRNPFELLVATILSAQCTDLRVNQVTPALFKRYPDPAALAAAELESVENLVKSTGFYRNKAKNLISCAEKIVECHAGNVPSDLISLVALPGVGRKTANVVLGNAFDIPGMVVDTHVKRISYRLGWSRQSDPEKVEKDLGRLLPTEKWNQTSHTLIHHGRAVCKAPTPICSNCPIFAECPRNGVSRSK